MSSRSAEGSIIAPTYARGTYFEDVDRHSEDAPFKVENFIKTFSPLRQSALGGPIRSYADVGCGSGLITQMIAQYLRNTMDTEIEAYGYDVSPQVERLNAAIPEVQFIHGDFCETEGVVDLVTMFDVFEHVPDPVGFLRKVAARCRLLALHIPLDDSLNIGLRNLYRRKLDDPEHLIFLDTASALNMLSLAGLRVLTYEYTLGFNAPSGHASLIAKLGWPLRALVAQMSPWFLSKTLGGCSLMVIATTPNGFESLAG